jgi:hypothetical protein
MTTPESPSVFLSYAQESEMHKSWVRRLAEDLVKNGVNTFLDQWDLHFGDDIGKFMERSIKEARYIVLVCTPDYGKGTNDREGGVGYEQAVFVGNLLMSRQLDSRFIPILRSGEASEALPTYLQSRLFIDFRDDNVYANSLDQLVRHLFGAQAFKRPPLGEPKFLGSVDANNVVDAQRTSTPSPPRGWILVAGTGNAAALTAKAEQTSKALGVSLANAGYGIVTGGWPGVDDLTARAFARELAPGIEKSKFSLVAREAPGVVVELIKLLDDWTNCNARTSA